VHAEPSHWLHEISISKSVCHHFAHKKLICNELELILKLSPNYLSRRLKTSYFHMEIWTRKDSSDSDIPAELTIS
jgi:hypothetical protein